MIPAGPHICVERPDVMTQVREPMGTAPDGGQVVGMDMRSELVRMTDDGRRLGTARGVPGGHRREVFTSMGGNHAQGRAI